MEDALRQILGKLDNLEKGQATMQADVNDLKSDVGDLKAGQIELRQSQVRMESEFNEKIRALFDFRQVQLNHNECVTNALARIEAKVDVLQMETANIRRVK